jgi:hypothetical protein
MNPDMQASQQRRQRTMTTMLGLVVFAFLVFTLVLLTGGFFIYVVGVGAFIGVFGFFHWMVWGKVLTEQTAGEREEAELLRRASSDSEPAAPSRPYSR